MENWRRRLEAPALTLGLWCIMRKNHSPSVSAGAAGYRKQNQAVGDLEAASWLRKIMLLVFRLVIYLVGGYLSMACAVEIGGNGHYPLIGFAVGPIFAIVVLLWQNDFVSSASLKFLILSTLIWCLVDWLLHVASGDKYFDLDILVGSILLPCAHAWIFRSSWRRACLAIVLSFVGFELSRLIPENGPNLVRRIINPAMLWQGGYLLAMFARRFNGPRAVS
jgi:hypothetical protein